jgi:MraZ protein
MLYGEFEHNLDDKGRVTLPAGFRAALAPSVFVTRGPDGCLLVFDLPGWSDVARKLKRGSISRQLARFLYAGSEVPLDSHGRVLIPAPLREYAELRTGEPVIVLGVDTRLELWNKQRWHSHAQSVVESGQFLNELQELGL